jgi:hypothetical protein
MPLRVRLTDMDGKSFATFSRLNNEATADQLESFAEAVHGLTKDAPSMEVYAIEESVLTNEEPESGE